MKLYTEEQVRKAMADSYIIGTDRENNCLQIEEYILKNLTPIELPNDEEIENETKDFMFEKNKEVFYNGAKWMKEQILNNK